MHEIIHDEEELKWFYDNIVPKLKDSEAHFVSLSARNKYLTDEERVSYGLGRTEMFERRIIRKNDWRRFLRTIRKFEVNEKAYVTKNDSLIPSKSIVCYFNINPSDVLKAYRDFNKVVNEHMYELAQCASTGHRTDNILQRIGKMPTTLMNAYQKATGTRHWIDFDFDIDKSFLPYLEKTVAMVKHFKGKAYIIGTKSGFHLLVSKDTNFSKDFNPKTLVETGMKDAEHHFYSVMGKDAVGLQEYLENIEIIHNKNSMIPLPGCLQGNYPVTILNKH